MRLLLAEDEKDLGIRQRSGIQCGMGVYLPEESDNPPKIP